MTDSSREAAALQPSCRIRPRPFDENYKPKLAYSAIAQAFAAPPPAYRARKLRFFSTHNDFPLTFPNYCSFMTRC